jgi:transposase
VAIGVDSHRARSPWLCWMRSVVLWGCVSSATTTRAMDRLLEWIDKQGPDRVIGIEGSGSYGAGLTRALLDAGDDVREVPAFLSHRERKRNPSLGKSDVHDAVAIDRVVARGDG